MYGKTYRCKKKKDLTVDSFIEEYISKQNSFNPHKSSPNKFIKKLEYRMKFYYNDMYNVFILYKK